MSGSAAARVARGRFTGRSEAAARMLLLLAPVAGVGLTTCLPPDIDIAPVVNQPLTIDRSKIDPSISPDRPINLFTSSNCQTLRIELSPADAITNPDKGELVFSYWLVNDALNPAEVAESSDLELDPPYAEPFVFDACKVADLVKGANANTVRLVVRDRAPVDKTAAAVLDTSDAPETSIAQVIWFITIDDDACCQVSP